MNVHPLNSNANQVIRVSSVIIAPSSVGDEVTSLHISNLPPRSIPPGADSISCHPNALPLPPGQDWGLSRRSVFAKVDEGDSTFTGINLVKPHATAGASGNQAAKHSKNHERYTQGTLKVHSKYTGKHQKTPKAAKGTTFSIFSRGTGNFCPLSPQASTLNPFSVKPSSCYRQILVRPVSDHRHTPVIPPVKPKSPAVRPRQTRIGPKKGSHSHTPTQKLT